MNFYDQANQRIVVVEAKATADFWDSHWQAGDFVGQVKAGKNNLLVKKASSRFLPKGARVLEGGCGLGQNVFGLEAWGYDAFGIDFAQKTIAKINQHFSGLKIKAGDVRSLDFPDDFFDGYWSLGVIEHFTDHSLILVEAKRVLKKNGYLFLTFPWLNPLRKWKAKRGDYANYEAQGEKNFYEFIFSEKNIIKELESLGFSLKMKKPFDAIKGLKDEISFGHSFWQKVYQSRNFAARCFRLFFSLLFARITGHAILLVFQKI
ncbi:MAG: class I SAM-dependent methyltransferase [Patescibacteria group bacterium]|nr:class I SAM-dependent methyltransferase [Patescibacteria group bacterium]